MNPPGWTSDDTDLSIHPSFHPHIRVFFHPCTASPTHLLVHPPDHVASYLFTHMCNSPIYLSFQLLIHPDGALFHSPTHSPIFMNQCATPHKYPYFIHPFTHSPIYQFIPSIHQFHRYLLGSCQIQGKSSLGMACSQKNNWFLQFKI